MFKVFTKTTAIKISKDQDVQKYINRAEELGYSVQANNYDPSFGDNYIILYPKEMRYNILVGWIIIAFNISTVPEEEFFGKEEVIKLNTSSVYACEIVEDIQKYINTAEDLGYTLCINLYKKYESLHQKFTYYIIMYPSSNKYNIFNTNFGYPIISQKQFFGTKTEKVMRKQVDKEILELLVKNTVESLDSFSIYDVTKIIRQKLPSHEISHDEVKDIVLEVCKNYHSSTNGVYRVFSKPNTKVQNAGFNVKQTGAVTSVSFAPSAAKVTTPTKAPSVITTVNVGSEGRITLNTSLLNKLFGNVSSVNILERDYGVLISNRPMSKHDKIVFGLPTRIRTRLKPGVAEVKEVGPSTYEICN